ncbi:MAG: tRNA 2-thiocytidine biosynthesis protein TtcA [Lentisphaeria bacterium]|nr:tRNA 2-thiocytidine biosynthesis protein TtcA [Lentisphaeria bacterium]
MDVFRELVKAAGETIGRYELISEGDRILAGLSGGKDSFAMLHVLHHLRKKAPVRFDVIAVTFDPVFPEFNIGGISRYCREQNWEHAVVKLDIPAILTEKNYTGTPCVLCSRLRRGKLYGTARELRCNKLALGQHFDDIVSSFLMSLFRGQGLTTMGPNVPNQEGDLRIIRPLALADEELIRRYAATLDLPQAGKCPYDERLKEGDRLFFQELLENLSVRIPDLRSQMKRSLSNVQLEYLLDPRYIKK